MRENSQNHFIYRLFQTHLTLHFLYNHSSVNIMIKYFNNFFLKMNIFQKCGSEIIIIKIHRDFLVQTETFSLHSFTFINMNEKSSKITDGLIKTLVLIMIVSVYYFAIFHVD